MVYSEGLSVTSSNTRGKARGAGVGLRGGGIGVAVGGVRINSSTRGVTQTQISAAAPPPKKNEGSILLLWVLCLGAGGAAYAFRSSFVEAFFALVAAILIGWGAVALDKSDTAAAERYKTLKLANVAESSSRGRANYP
jgi:hypothetical protein